MGGRLRSGFGKGSLLSWGLVVCEGTILRAMALWFWGASLLAVLRPFMRWQVFAEYLASVQGSIPNGPGSMVKWC